ncbi:MAG: hypothetical protein ACE5FJ_05105 [Gemmatimonadales bacterium]
MHSTSGIAMTLGGAVTGFLLIGILRFFMMPLPPEPIHYHANFALVINGESFDFAQERYMQDVQACKVNPDDVLPVERAHMHELVPDVAHIHADGVTWGHFFANVGFTIGDDFVFTDRGDRYFNDDMNRLKFVLNGEQVASIVNREVVSEDRLLISYGPEPLDVIIQAQFDSIASTASIFNSYHQDAGGCSAGSGEELSTLQRIKQAFFW